MTTLKGDELEYLRSLVRMDIRKRQKSVDRFTRRDDQTEEEAEAILASFKANVRFRMGVYASLTREKEARR